MRHQLLTLCLVACGHPDPATSADAGDVTDAGTDAADDAATDAATDAAVLIPADAHCDPTQSGTVRIHPAGGSPGAVIMVHDVNGHLLSRQTASVVTNLTVPGCGSVTFARPQSYYYETITYVAVGDELYEGLPPPLRDGTLRGPAKLHLAAPIDGASYRISGAAYSTTTGPESFNAFWQDALVTTPGHGTLAVHTTLPSGEENPEQYVLLEDVSLVNAMTTPLEASAWSSAARTFQVHVAIPGTGNTGLSFVSLLREVGYTTGQIEPVLATNTATFSIRVPAYTDGLLLFTGVDRSSFQLRMSQPAFTDVNIDAAAELLPKVLSLSSTPTTPPTFHWTLGPATNHQPDMALLTVRGPATWRVSVPPSQTSYQLPELPPDLAPDFSAVQETGLRLYETSDAADYGEIRPRFNEALGRSYLPVDGVARYSQIGLD